MVDDIYKNLREFRSPRDYVWQECAVKEGKIYQVTNQNGTGGRWIPEDWREVAITEFDFTSIDNSIEALTYFINQNTNEIQRMNILIAKLVFELVSQGVDIQDVELINQIKLYIK